MKRTIVAAVAGVMLVGCAQPAAPIADGQAVTGQIHVITREAGSGTRGAFTELFEVEYRGEDGSFEDLISLDATIANGTGAVIGAVSGDVSSIGYITLGSMNDQVRALTIDGIEATPQNILDGIYTAARPFNIAFSGQPEALAQDFIDFIMSAEGQAVVALHEYVPADTNAPAFTGGDATGRIVVGGSTAVTPLMEHLQEAYLALNPAAEIEIQMMGSGAGMTGAIEGTLDIGMASRPLSESEMGQLNNIEIAVDGLVIVVNNANPISDLPFGAVREIFSGEVVAWEALN